MNAEQLIEEVIDIVQDADYEDSEVILGVLNGSLKKIATLLLLPELDDGHDTVTTATDAFVTALPSNFGKSLFLAQVDGIPVDIHKDIKTLSMHFSGVSVEAGDISGVATYGRNLAYQDVPEVATDIELFYYRKPTPMRESATSYPDGLSDSDDFDWALIHDACSKLFNKIEDGMEGAKVNTMEHRASFDARILALDEYADNEGKSFNMRASVANTWLGTT